MVTAELTRTRARHGASRATAASASQSISVETGPRPYLLVPLNTTSEKYLTEKPKDTPQENLAKVVFDVTGGNIQIWVYDAKADTWFQSGKGLPVQFMEGDTFIASVNAKGMLEIQRNGKLFATVDINP